MKIVRLWLLLLLVVLLPLRGAMARAVLCEPGDGDEYLHVEGRLHRHSPTAAHVHADGEVDHHHVNDGQAEPVHSLDEQESAGESDKVDRCSLCAAYCCTTPLAFTIPPVPLPSQLGLVFFAQLKAPPPIFLSEGQERPPKHH